VFVTGTGLSREPSRTATMWAAEKGRREGATVVLDVDYRPVLWPNTETFGTAVRALARLAHLVIGTEQEVEAAASGEPANTAVRSLVELGPAAVVLKRGADGATIVRCGGQRTDIPPFRVDILNTLGAGDAFASGFLYGFLHDWPLERAAGIGNATGAIV